MERAAIEGCSDSCSRAPHGSRHAAKLSGVKADRAVGDSASPKKKPLLRKATRCYGACPTISRRAGISTAPRLADELVNEIMPRSRWKRESPAVAREVFELLILMMAPMVPHLAEELWEMLGHTGETLARAPWPKCPETGGEDQVEIVEQINSRVREKS